MIIMTQITSETIMTGKPTGAETKYLVHKIGNIF